MPIRKPNLSKEELRKFRALILRLRAAGIDTGISGLPPVPERLGLWQLEYLFCRVHDLPGAQVAVILLCELMALSTGASIRDCTIWLPWGPELELCDPEDTPYYDDVIRGLPKWPPTVLNPWLRGEVSLPRGRKLTGIIIASGWVPIPAEYPDDSPVDVEIVVSNDQGSQLEFLFKAGVDRSVKRGYERKRQPPVDALRLTRRRSLLECEDSETRDQDRTIQRQVRGPMPSPVIVSAEKTIEGSSPNVPREETDTPIGEV
jgi:hypothetical protein